MRLVFLKPEGNPRADTLLPWQSVSFHGAALALKQLLAPSTFGFAAVFPSAQSLTGLDSHVSSVMLLSAQGMSLLVLDWGLQGFWTFAIPAELGTAILHTGNTQK